MGRNGSRVSVGRNCLYIVEAGRRALWGPQTVLIEVMVSLSHFQAPADHPARPPEPMPGIITLFETVTLKILCMEKKHFITKNNRKSDYMSGVGCRLRITCPSYSFI